MPSPTSHAPNLVELAVRDITTAAAILRKPRGGVLGLDVRSLTGGATALEIGPRAFDVYCGAIDLALGHTKGLTMRGYEIRRARVDVSYVPAPEANTPLPGT